MKKKNGFTLAEVLITLAIIGIVAALTIPTLMTDSRYQLVSSRISKFVSTTEDAALAQAAMNGAIEASNLDEIVLYKSKKKLDYGVDRWRYDLKDGTTLEIDLGSIPQATELPEAFNVPEKYGTPIANLDFYHNVSGLNDVRADIPFIMTNKGYISPLAADTCSMALFDNNNDSKTPWKLTKSIAENECEK